METSNLEQKPRMANPFPHAMRWGLALGGCFVVNFLMSVSGIMVLSVLTWVLDIVILWLIYRFACNYRDTECGGAIRYGQVFVYVWLLVFFAALIAGAVKFLYLQFLAPDYLSNLYSQLMIMFEESGLSLPNGFAEQFQAMMQPIQYTFQSITMDCLLGCMVGVIYGFCIRRA